MRKSDNKNDIKRLVYLDMAKGIGIILVVMGHSASLISDDMLTWIASFHMPLFFVISGILFLHRCSYSLEPEKFLKRRFMGMIVPYISFTVIYMAVYHLMNFFIPGIIPYENIKLAGIMGISGYGISVLWFLSAIFYSEVVLYAICRKLFGKVDEKSGLWGMPDRNGWVMLSAVGMAAGIISTYGKLWSDMFHSSVNGSFIGELAYYFMVGILRVFPGLVFLICGMMFGRFILRVSVTLKGNVIYTGNAISSSKVLYSGNSSCPAHVKQERSHNPAVFFVAGIGLMALNIAVSLKNGRVDLHYLDFRNSFYFYLAALSGSFGLILLCRNLKEIWLLSFAGKNSLIIMATHLDCQFLYFAGHFSTLTTLHLTRYKDVIFKLNYCIILAIIEIIVVVLVNRYLYFLIGKSAPVKMKMPRFMAKIMKKRGRNGIRRIK